MPKKVEYVQCDNDAGQLISFAKTALRFGSCIGDGGTNAEFWVCPVCNTIYFRHRYSSGCYIRDEPDDYSELERFYYRATREELCEHAEHCSGSYSSFEDQHIIETRARKLAVLNKLEATLKELRDLCQVSTCGKWVVSVEPEVISKNGLCVVTIVRNREEKHAWCKKSSGIRKDDEVVVVIEKILFWPEKQVECLFALK